MHMSIDLALHAGYVWQESLSSVMGTGATLRNWLSATDTNPKGPWEKGFFDLCPD